MVLARNLVIRVILVQRYKKNRKKQNKTMINLANWIILRIFANEFIFLFTLKQKHYEEEVYLRRLWIYLRRH